MRGPRAQTFVALAATCTLSAIAPVPAGAVVVESSRSSLSVQPQNGYVGLWNGASAVAVGPNWIISARHVGGAPGTLFTLDGYRYEATRVVAHPTRDLLLAELSEPLPGWHALAPLAVAGQEIMLGGMGFRAGNFIGNGYDWSGGAGLAWGRNRLDGVGVRMSFTFDAAESPDAVEGEGIFTMLDSGGGLFTLTDDGALQLAGIAVTVSGTFGQSVFGSRAYAVNLDPVNAWIVSHISPGEPIASSLAPPSGLVIPPSPPVPAPATGAALLLLGSAAAAGRRRR